MSASAQGRGIGGEGRARPSGQALVSDGAQEVSTLTGFDPSREVSNDIVARLHGRARFNRDHAAIKDAEIQEQAALQIERLRGQIAAVRSVIQRGYPDKGLRRDQRCEHERFGFEDCMGCYDEALLTALGCDTGS